MNYVRANTPFKNTSGVKAATNRVQAHWGGYPLDSSLPHEIKRQGSKSARSHKGHSWRFSTPGQQSPSEVCYS